MHYEVHYKAQLMHYNYFYNALYIKALSVIGHICPTRTPPKAVHGTRFSSFAYLLYIFSNLFVFSYHRYDPEAGTQKQSGKLFSN